jgi:hypothetical protein
VRRLGCGCGSCFLWLIIVVLLTDGWLGSSWAWRAVELLTGLAVIVAVAYRQHRTSVPSESQSTVPGP